MSSGLSQFGRETLRFFLAESFRYKQAGGVEFERSGHSRDVPLHYGKRRRLNTITRVAVLKV